VKENKSLVDISTVFKSLIIYNPTKTEIDKLNGKILYI